MAPTQAAIAKKAKKDLREQIELAILTADQAVSDARTALHEHWDEIRAREEAARTVKVQLVPLLFDDLLELSAQACDLAAKIAQIAPPELLNSLLGAGNMNFDTMFMKTHHSAKMSKPIVDTFVGNLPH